MMPIEIYNQPDVDTMTFFKTRIRRGITEEGQYFITINFEDKASCGILTKDKDIADSYYDRQCKKLINHYCNLKKFEF